MRTKLFTSHRLGKSRWIQLLGSVAMLTMSAISAGAQVSYLGGTSYTQDFNSLGTNSVSGWSNNTTLTGWYALAPAAAFNPATNIITQTGSGSAGALANFSSGAVNENRSLGWVYANSIGAVGAFASIGVGFSNQTGETLSSFQVSYIGREWRGYSNNLPSLSVQYKIGGNFDNLPVDGAVGGSWVDLPALTFTLPVTNNSIQLDGLLEGNYLSLTGGSFDLDWEEGVVLWLRWRQENLSGTDAQLAIDDVSFSAVPEPQMVVLLLCGGAVLLTHRVRSRKYIRLVRSGH